MGIVPTNKNTGGRKNAKLSLGSSKIKKGMVAKIDTGCSNHKTVVAKMQKMVHWFQHRERWFQLPVMPDVAPRMPVAASRPPLSLVEVPSAFSIYSRHPGRSSVVAVMVATPDSPSCCFNHRRSSPSPPSTIFSLCHRRRRPPPSLPVEANPPVG